MHRFLRLISPPKHQVTHWSQSQCVKFTWQTRNFSQFSEGFNEVNASDECKTFAVDNAIDLYCYKKIKQTNDQITKSELQDILLKKASVVDQISSADIQSKIIKSCIEDYNSFNLIQYPFASFGT